MSGGRTKVFFGGGFWGGRGNGRAGTELRLETQFDWAGRHWVVPAAYACGKGLVVDVCMRAEADEIRRFLKTWDLSPENDSRDNFTPEQQLQIDLDNPLGMRPDPQLTLNGQPLQLCKLRDGIKLQFQYHKSYLLYGLFKV